jgi:hypothetical protein
MPPAPSRRGPFPIQHACVVQFAAGTVLEVESISERVEPVESGQASRF